ncbi:MAG: PTS IIA-like nitrogen regulatory protein PtsN [Gammaproteobacteria bacterium]|jgi:PTS system nitrogen regulatory IIA component|nr:PTS IIA-like nitrogen regulatory protein PtsN [Gammaproteobacteria bacterium]
MNITDLLIPERVTCCHDVGSKKRLLEYISELLANSSLKLSQNDIFNALLSREKLGSTGLGKGVAIPHGRMTSLEKPVCAFVKLDTPIDFDASDGQPVDLIFTLLVPEDSTEEHLQVLSTIAEIFSNTGISMALRQCDSDSCLLEQLSQWEAQRISA